MDLTIDIGHKRRKRGIDLEVIDRIGDVALVRCTQGSWEGWEVWKISQCKERTFPGGTVVPAHEAPPGDNQWGDKGWSYGLVDMAIDKVAELLQAPKTDPDTEETVEEEEEAEN